MTPPDPRFEGWLQSLEARHLADLTFPQVSSALRALSSTYVERRERLAAGAALDGAGKRAAVALFYAPLHYLVVRAIVRALPLAREPTATLVDLGCGTGAAGAAWAASLARAPRVIGVDRHPWALAEAARTYRAFGLIARTRQSDIAAVLPSICSPREGRRTAFAEATPRRPKRQQRGRRPDITTALGPTSILAAYAVNELADRPRDRLLQQLLDRADRGVRVLVVEPIAGKVAPWWKHWCAAFESAGGRGDLWRFRLELPAIVARLDRAAGLDHRELTARSLWIDPLSQRRA